MPICAVDAPFERADLDVDGLLEIDAGALDDDGVAAHLVALHRLRVFVDAAVTATAGVFDARAVWARDGARNAPGWITARTNAFYGAGKADVALARELRHMPVVAEAFAAGRLGREQVRLLAKARADGLEEIFATCEEVLVDEVVGCTVAGAARLLRRWAATVRKRLGLADPDQAPPAELDHGSRIHLSCGFEGRWALDGSLDPETGEVLANAIDHQVDARWRDGVFHAEDGLVPAERPRHRPGRGRLSGHPRRRRRRHRSSARAGPGRPQRSAAAAATVTPGAMVSTSAAPISARLVTRPILTTRPALRMRGRCAFSLMLMMPPAMTPTSMARDRDVMGHPA